MRDSKGKFIKGYKPIWSEESRRRVSESLKGVNTWSRGRKLTEEHKRKVKENTARYWLGKKRGPQSEEWKKKIADALRGKKNPNSIKALLANNPIKGKFGKNHPGWVENKKHPLNLAIRSIFKYKEWRTSIFKRDNFLCVLCGKDGELNADHCPIRFIDIIRKYQIKNVDEAINCKELWNINDGRTLCKKCHLKTPTWGRRLS